MIKLKPDNGENIVEDMFGNKVDWSTMTVSELIEHKDGSATLKVDMTTEQVQMFMDIMMRSALVMYLRQTEEDTKDATATIKKRGSKTEGKTERTPATRRAKAAKIAPSKKTRGI